MIRILFITLLFLMGNLGTLSAQTSRETELETRTRALDKEIDKTIRYFNNSQKNKSHVDIARCYQKIGQLFQDNALYGFAIVSYMESLYYERLAHANHFVTYRRIASCFFYIGNYKEAMHFLKEASKQSNGMKEREVEIAALQTVTSCAQHNLEAAENYRERMERRYAALETKKSDEIQSIYHRAQFYYYGMIQHDWTKALAEHALIQKERNELRKYYELGMVYAAMGDTAKATLNYARMEDRLSAIRKTDLSPLFQVYTNILDYKKRETEYEAAEKEARRISLEQAKLEKELLEKERITNEHKLAQENSRAELNKSKDALQMKQLKEQIEEKRRTERIKQQRESTHALANEVNSMILTYGLILVIVSLVLLLAYTIFEVLHSVKIKRERDSAIRAEQMKSLFFQNMNHEIRTPLNAIAGFNELLHGDMADELTVEEKTEMTELIESNANMLVTLVNDVLDISNFESGSYKLHYSKVNIHRLCHHVVESTKNRVAKGVKVIYAPDEPEDFLLYTDEERLTQVLTNFMTNACKYTEKGSITLGYDIYHDTVLFHVTDTGRGIPKGEEQAVFQRFHMVANSKKGIGMGLHICDMIAQLMHGSVYVDTEYRTGARFCFEHPITEQKHTIALCKHRRIRKLAQWLGIRRRSSK